MLKIVCNNMIKDSVYLVTGAASGLGEATADLLLAEGAFVAALDLHPFKSDKYQQNNKLLLIQADVTSENAIKTAMDEILTKFGKLNGIIHCAGIVIKPAMPIYNPVTKQAHSLEEFTRIINVNLIGTFNVNRLAIPLLIENEPNFEGERGIIINTSSILAHYGTPLLYAYSVSKWGVRGMTQPLAKEMSQYGIRVLDIAPGAMDTDMLKPVEESENSPGLYESQGFPRRMGHPQEFAQAVKSLIENVFFNGTSIRLDAALLC